MPSRIWLKFGLLVAGGVIALLLLTGKTRADDPLLLPEKARADDPRIEELQQRLFKLEQQNAALMEHIKNIHTPTSSTQEEGGLTKKEVERLVQEELKKRDEAAKKAEAKKKEEAEAKKKKEDAKKKEEDAKKKEEDEAKKKKEDEAKKKAEAEKFVEVGSDLSLKGKWKHGPYLEAPNGDFYVHLRGRIDYDLGWFRHDPELPEFHDASSFRRARLGMEGKFWEVIYWIAEFDFADPNAGTPTTSFADVFVEIQQLPWVGNFRAGHFKEFFSLEQLTSANYIMFMERSILDDAFVPGRNVGLAVHRPFGEDERVWAGTGIWRTTANAGGFDQGDGQYAWTSRLTALPYWSNEGRCFVHVGGAYSHRAYQGVQADDNPIFQARPEIRLGTPVLVSTGSIVGAGDQELLGGEFAAVFGPFTVQSEIMWTQVDGPRRTQDVDYWGYYVQASYFLTGEHRPYKKSIAALDRVIPHEPFFFVEGCHGTIFGRGAWEVAARYSYLDLRDPNLVVPTAANRSGGTGILQDVTLGVNWYLSPQSRIMFNYIHSWRDSDTPGRDGDVDIAAMRFHVDW